MDDAPLINDQNPALVGRDQAFARLQHHLNSPTDVPPVTFLGRKRSGKTALLRQFQTSTHVDTIAVYVPIKHIHIENEAGWIHALSQIIAEAVSHQGYSSGSVEPFPEDAGTFREWFAAIYLPALFRLIRPHRRLAILLDDADQLLHAVTSEHLPADSFIYLHELLHPQLGIALTINLQYESELRRFTPLVSTNAVHRLMNLTQETITQYLEVQTEPTYTGEAILTTYQLTGGEPFLFQKFYQHANQHPQQSMAIEDIKTIGTEIYRQEMPYFREVWENLQRDERLVLTAISSLIYNNPLQKIDTSRIESWLVETDYPLDTTSINAVIRSLEYDEVLDGTATNIKVKSGLMQKWLLENALLEEQPPIEAASNPRMWILVAGILIVLAVALILTISLGSSSHNVPTPVEPTITLIPGN